jgi:hypothetical protein
MPDNTTTNVSPSNSIIDRIMGRSPSDPAFDARMNLAKQAMTNEMPTQMAGASIEPTGFIGRMMDSAVSKLIGGTPVATTNPFGGISYNPEQLKGMNQNELEDTLAHELTHVGQFQQMSPWEKFKSSLLPAADEGLPEETKKAFRMQGYDPAYRGKSTEMEAYNTEQQRQLKRGQGFPGYDIDLRPPVNKSNVNTAPSSKVLKTGT